MRQVGFSVGYHVVSKMIEITSFKRLMGYIRRLNHEIHMKLVS